MRMKYLLLLVFVITDFAFGVSGGGILDIYTTPNRPVKNEAFELVIKADIVAGEEFRISFGAKDFEVLNRRLIREDLRTLTNNGKITTIQKTGYAYSMVTDKVGSLGVTNIRFESGDKLLAAARFEVVVQSSAPRPKDQFVEVVISKNSIIKGEGIDLRYFLATSIPFISQEVKQYPKLDGFIKRFRDTNPRIERFASGNKVYQRVEVYAARLYPQKIGKIAIDPISVKINYPPGATPQGYSGMSTVASEKIFVEVLDYPIEKLPANFSGLIGNHELEIYRPQQSFNINVPITVRLIVTGPGNLEELVAPPLYVNKNLEDFDVKSEIKTINETTSSKIFDYTYLGRGPLNIADSKLTISMFDPERRQYFEKAVKLPGIIVAANGGASNSTSIVDSGEEKSMPNASKKTDKNLASKIDHLMPPEFILRRDTINYFKSANVVIAIVSFLILLSFFIQRPENDPLIKKISGQIALMKKKGVVYSSLYNLIFDSKAALLSTEDVAISTQLSLSEIIEKSQLSDNAKKYFQVLISRCENETFNNKQEKINFRNNYFKEIVSLIRRKKIK